MTGDHLARESSRRPLAAAFHARRWSASAVLAAGAVLAMVFLAAGPYPHVRGSRPIVALLLCGTIAALQRWPLPVLAVAAGVNALAMAMGNVPVPFGVVLGLAVFFVASGMPRRWSVPAAAVTAAGLGAALLYAALAVPHASPASEIVEGFVPLVAPWFVITISQPLGVSYRLYYYYVMTQREKRSVSLPPDLARAVDQAAEAQGTTFSGWLAETAARRLKLEAGRQAIAEWERENGPLTEAERADGLARARASLGRAPAPAPAPATERKSA